MLWSSGVACLTGDPIVFLRVLLVMFLLAICVDCLLLFMSGVACLTSDIILDAIRQTFLLDAVMLDHFL